MTTDPKPTLSLEDPELVSMIDELSLWSAPFGLALLDAVHYGKHLRVLDIGSGLGFPIVELAMRLGETSLLTGIDPWHEGCKRIRQKCDVCGVRNIHVVEGTAEDMPFADSLFDMIVSNNGINNVEDLGRTLEECGRVLKKGGQFVFTMNTEKTFIEFYEVLRSALRDAQLKDGDRIISDHIYLKRRPIDEIKRRLNGSGFKVNSLREDCFSYRFSDGSAMLNHFFIRLAFGESWKKLVPSDIRESVFRQVENEINDSAMRTGAFSMQVPFVTVDCERV